MLALWTVYMGPASRTHISNCATLTFSVKYYSLLAHNAAFVGNCYRPFGGKVSSCQDIGWENSLSKLLVPESLLFTQPWT